MKEWQAVQLKQFYLQEAKRYQEKDIQVSHLKSDGDLETFRKYFADMNRDIIKKYGVLEE